MEKISFVLPLNRFEESDKLATRAALRHALHVSDPHIDEMIRDAAAHNQFLLNFRCDPSQFAKFLIMRHELGGKNWFADLKARVIDKSAPLQNRRIVDFTIPIRYDAMAPYRIHDDMPQHFVDEQNARRKERSFPERYGAPMNPGRPFGAVKAAGASAYDSSNWTGTVSGRVNAMNPLHNVKADLVIALHDGTIMKSNHEINTSVEEGGFLLVTFKPPVAKTPAELGVAAHALVEALMADVTAENEKLRKLLRRAVSIIKNGVRVMGRMRAGRRGEALANAFGEMPTFMRHGESLVNDTKEIVS